MSSSGANTGPFDHLDIDPFPDEGLSSLSSNMPVIKAEAAITLNVTSPSKPIRLGGGFVPYVNGLRLALDRCKITCSWLDPVPQRCWFGLGSEGSFGGKYLLFSPITTTPLRSHHDTLARLDEKPSFKVHWFGEVPFKAESKDDKPVRWFPTITDRFIDDNVWPVVGHPEHSGRWLARMVLPRLLCGAIRVFDNPQHILFYARVGG